MQPVQGVEVVGSDHVAQPLGGEDAPQHLQRGAVVAAVVGRPDQRCLGTGDGTDRSVGADQFELRPPVRGFREIGVRHGVIGDEVSLASLTAGQLRVGDHRLAQVEERHGHVFAGQQVQQGLGVLRIRSVVEGQRDGPGLPGDVAVALEDEGAVAGSGGFRRGQLPGRGSRDGVEAEDAAGVGDQAQQPHQGPGTDHDGRPVGIEVGREQRVGRDAARQRVQLGPEEGDGQADDDGDGCSHASRQTPAAAGPVGEHRLDDVVGAGRPALGSQVVAGTFPEGLLTRFAGLLCSGCTELADAHSTLRGSQIES